MVDHTPTPWECDWGPIPPDGPGTYCDVYVDGGDTIIARVNDCIECGHANADFIVKAVNHHEAMVEALEICKGALEACAGMHPDNGGIAKALSAARATLAAVGTEKQP